VRGFVMTTAVSKSSSGVEETTQSGRVEVRRRLGEGPVRGIQAGVREEAQHLSGDDGKDTA
jgi:hypothetical protein